MTITPDNLRAARAFLKWTQRDLESRSGVNRQTINDIENGRRKRAPLAETSEQLIATFAAHGVAIMPPPADGVVRIPRG